MDRIRLVSTLSLRCLQVNKIWKEKKKLSGYVARGLFPKGAGHDRYTG